MNPHFGKTKRVMIKEEPYEITQISASRFYVRKEGAPPPGYLVKLPSECHCRSWQHPCKHIAPTLQFCKELTGDSKLKR